MSQYLDKDGASRIAENFLSKQAEQDAILQNLQFDLKEAEHALVKTIQGPAPLNIRALARPLDDYLISGNTLQDGTPTPDAPVDVVGCGVRTGNLFDKDVYLHNGTSTQYINCYAHKLSLKPNTTYTLSSNVPVNGSDNHLYITNDASMDSFSIIYNNHPVTFTTNPDGSIYFMYATRRYYNDLLTNVYYIMLNLGSTPLQYEPFGYKLPLTCGGTEHPIYLGQVETTRRVKKLVLTGEEGWTITSNGVLRIGLSGQLRPLTPLCTHYLGSNSTAWSNVPDKSVTVSISGYLAILDTTYTAVSDFKSYLAVQYAAGTPVTVWYVLAEPETAIINEPLHKIGNYADTISMTQANITLTTTKGFNTITTDTTVLPSNVQVKGVINNA